VPEKLDRCVDKVKAKGNVENPWAVCNASVGKETKGVKEKVNENRQVPVANPPLKVNRPEPKIDKTTKDIGGKRLDKNSFLWKDIFDSQLKRNVKEPRI